MADNSGWMPIGEEDVTPAMEMAWASMLDAVEMLNAALADPACADQVAARRLWLRGRALLVCAEQTEGDEAARRKLAAVAVLAHYEDASGRLAVAMAERAVQADLDRLGLSTPALSGNGTVH